MIRQSDSISIGTSPEPMQHGCVKALLGQKVAINNVKNTETKKKKRILGNIANPVLTAPLTSFNAIYILSA